MGANVREGTLSSEADFYVKNYFYRLNKNRETFDRWFSVTTTGGRDVQAFSTSGEQFLAYSFAGNGVSTNLKSPIIRLNNEPCIYRFILGKGLTSVKFFEFEGINYLFAINNYDSSSSEKKVLSYLYRW